MTKKISQVELIDRRLLEYLYLLMDENWEKIEGTIGYSTCPFCKNSIHSDTCPIKKIKSSINAIRQDIKNKKG